MSVASLSWRAWVRAGMITFALAVHVLYALPSPHALKPSDVKSAEGREEIERWRVMLEGVGIEASFDDLAGFTMWWTREWSDWHRWLRKPFRPWMRFTGTGQAWALFANPDTHPHRLEIYVLEGTKWKPVFRRNHPELDFLDSALRYRRVRGVYDGSTSRQRVPYWNFCRWVAREALLAHPEASRVRVQMVQLHTTVPWEPVDASEVVRVKRVFTRTAILPEDGLVP